MVPNFLFIENTFVGRLATFRKMFMFIYSSSLFNHLDVQIVLNLAIEGYVCISMILYDVPAICLCDLAFQSSGLLSMSCPSSDRQDTHGARLICDVKIISESAVQMSSFKVLVQHTM